MVNDDSSKLISGSTDGSIKLWDYKSTECIMNFVPPSDTEGIELDINSIIDLGKRGVGSE